MGRKKPDSQSARNNSGESKAPRTKNVEAQKSDDENDGKSKANSDSVTDEAASSAGAPINVYFRLTYPLVNSEMEEYDSDEEDSVELNVSPRLVYAASLCVVCMAPATNLCDGCAMIPYCSPAHKEQSFMMHASLCEALTEIRLMEAYTPEMGEIPTDHYRVYRLRLLEALTYEIGRPLQLWEREIILYPRVCRICHRAPPDLACCEVCAAEFFCKDHENEHEKWCQEFRVFRRCLFMQRRHGRADAKVPSVRHESPVELPGDFDSLMLQIYGRTPYYCAMDCHTYTTLSHMATIPLTSLYALQIARADWPTLDSLVIHVIGAEFLFECVNLQVWEKLFAHFLPSLRRLALVFVGPELQLPGNIPRDFLARVRLCTACRSAGFSLGVTFHPARFYHDVAREQALAKPDLVCLFNPGLYRETGFAGLDSWPDTIREFCKTEAPIVVTSYTEAEIPQEVTRIKSICPEAQVLLEPRRNPYASIKPDRNFVSEDTAPLIYKNYYLTVLKGKA